MTARFSVCLVLTLLVSILFATTLSAQTCANCSCTNCACANCTCANCPQTQSAPPCAQPCPAPAPTCTQPCPAPLPPTASVGGGVSWELYPNAGGIWPTRVDTLSDNKIKAQGIYGLKGGVFFGSTFELEGSFGYLNHFEPSRSPNPFNFNTDGGFGQPSVLGFLYDLNFAVNFGNRSVFGAKVNPYLVTGGGALTTEVRNGSSAFLDGGGLVLTPGGLLVPNPTSERILHDGDTWFTVNYGGGVKFQNLWGPLGVRVDVRGRTLPNFFRSSTTWIEATGGLLFSFGQH